MSRFSFSPNRSPEPVGTPWWARFGPTRYAGGAFDGELPPAERVGRVLVTGAALLTLGVLLVGLYVLYLIPTTPAADELRAAADPKPSILLAADGETELMRYDGVNRKWLPLDSIPAALVDALIATEDRDFYGHNGVDFTRVLGAGLATAKGDMQGGSTLTQQLARNLYPDEIGRDISIRRKLKEMVVAKRIEKVHPKDKILESYLNTVPFLYNVHGVELAAQTYFKKSAVDLEPQESATLVGMLKGTSYYNPIRNPERSLERRNLVLRLMGDTGRLSAAEVQQLQQTPLGVELRRQPGRQVRAPHFVEAADEAAREWADQNGYRLEHDGLVIRTTLDWAMQQAAERVAQEEGDGLQAVADVEWSQAALRSYGGSTSSYASRRAGVQPFAYFYQRYPQAFDRHAEATARFEALRARGLERAAALDTLRQNAAFVDSLREAKTRLEIGLVALDPKTGAVKAYVGSRDWEKGAFDHARRAKRQPGSTFKPFVYAAALEQGFSPYDRLMDEEVKIDLGGGTYWSPKNSGGSVSNQLMTLADGLAYSKNTITAQVMRAVGPQNVARLAHELGVDSELDAVPSLALGTSDVTLLEMVSAYGTLANDGLRREPRFLQSIEVENGPQLATFGGRGERALDERFARGTIAMMQGVVEKGTGRRLNSYGLGGDWAAKTGTTQNGADGWFIAANPALVVGSWVGFSEPAIRFRSNYWGQGAHTALPVVGDFLRSSRDAIAYGAFPDTPVYARPAYLDDEIAQNDSILAMPAPELNLDGEGDFREVSLDDLEADLNRMDDGRQQPPTRLGDERSAGELQRQRDGDRALDRDRREAERRQRELDRTRRQADSDAARDLREAERRLDERGTRDEKKDRKADRKQDEKQDRQEGRERPQQERRRDRGDGNAPNRGNASALAPEADPGPETAQAPTASQPTAPEPSLPADTPPLPPPTDD